MTLIRRTTAITSLTVVIENNRNLGSVRYSTSDSGVRVPPQHPLRLADPQERHPDGEPVHNSPLVKPTQCPDQPVSATPPRSSPVPQTAIDTVVSSLASLNRTLGSPPVAWPTWLVCDLGVLNSSIRIGDFGPPNPDIMQGGARSVNIVYTRIS